ncbi:MAG TPA: ferredoxin [Candidatus Nanoarchaeia archaeon]|nr:ferredoxin [Candidatus Nanoarchaeia archaeon]
MPIKIKFDKEACIGCGACSSVCDNWVMEDDKARPKKIDFSKQELKSNKEAEEACPVQAIKIEGGS